MPEIAVGSADDMARRLRRVIPQRWFRDDAPVLAAILAGLSATWAWVYATLQYLRLQTRIATLSDGFLDIASLDYFGGRLPRRSAESDVVFRSRIQKELLRTHATRGDLVTAIIELTGQAPVVFEPARPADTGAWNQATGYGVAGAYGSLNLPFQCLVTVHRANAAGPDCDEAIYSTVAASIPVATIAWTRIVN